jgi:hypothetical protein
MAGATTGCRGSRTDRPPTFSDLLSLSCSGSRQPIRLLAPAWLKLITNAALSTLCYIHMLLGYVGESPQAIACLTH